MREYPANAPCIHLGGVLMTNCAASLTSRQRCVGGESARINGSPFVIGRDALDWRHGNGVGSHWSGMRRCDDAGSSVAVANASSWQAQWP